MFKVGEVQGKAILIDLVKSFLIPQSCWLQIVALIQGIIRYSFLPSENESSKVCQKVFGQLDRLSQDKRRSGTSRQWWSSTFRTGRRWKGWRGTISRSSIIRTVSLFTSHKTGGRGIRGRQATKLLKDPFFGCIDAECKLSQVCFGRSSFILQHFSTLQD